MNRKNLRLMIFLWSFALALVGLVLFLMFLRGPAVAL